MGRIRISPPIIPFTIPTHAQSRHRRTKHLFAFNYHYIIQLVACKAIPTASPFQADLQHIRTQPGSKTTLNTYKIYGGKRTHRLATSHTTPQPQYLSPNAVEDLITGDFFNLQHLSKSTSLHPILIHESIQQLQSQLTCQQPLANTE